MKSITCLLGATLAMSFATVSSAAVVVESSMTGVAAVSQSGRVRVAVGSTVNGQTRIVVGRGRIGQDTVLRYTDGCEVRLRPGQVYTVLDVSPCAPPARPEPVTETPVLGGITAPAVVGVAVAGAIAGGVVAATSGKGSGTPPIYISP